MNIIINPDKDLAAGIKKILNENDWYCPCKLMKTKYTKCMCKEFKER